MTKYKKKQGVNKSLQAQLDKQARHAGLRIHECFRIDTAAAEQALSKGGNSLH